MFKFAKDVNLNKISNTGVRGIVLLALLTTKPRSLEELKKAYIDCGIMSESSSKDIIRIDLNTLKHAGCKISRCTKGTKYKYILEEHPYIIEFDENEIEFLKRIYNKAKKEAKILKLLDYDEFFTKLANYVQDENIKEQILGISELKHYNKELIRDIYFACNKKYNLKLAYERPTSKTIVIKNIVAQKLVVQNNKIYLYGYDNDIKKSTVLNFKRIKEIILRAFDGNEKETNLIKIKFYLKDDFIDVLDENEIIIETIGDTYIIEGVYYNEFYATQRILSFGKNCKVIEPDDFKKHIISKIKEMRGIYGD